MTPDSGNTYWQCFVSCLKKEFLQSLPGIVAQKKMASSHRIETLNFPGHLSSHTPDKAAVLLLLYPSDKHINTIIIKRARYNGPHSGQISFPGGKREKEDLSFEQTALREAFEETGIPPEKVKIIGPLTPLFIPASNSMVYPYTGIMDMKPKLTPDPHEVSEIIETNIHHFLTPGDAVGCMIVKTNRGPEEVPCFNIGKYHMWGATAMILNEYLTIHRKAEKCI